ncbi:hypothetical protein ACSNOK_01980 [Streptomyces sp. URMC 126]|uniref:hypothetical protein n=1 Tax=Streptomyces sp. URMC 126 TaxID=3423401 RepID=UPI003F1BF604
MRHGCAPRGAAGGQTGRITAKAGRTHVLALLAAAWALTTCGVSDAGPAAAGAPAAGARPAGAGPQEALDALLAGPTPEERGRGLGTALPRGAHRVRAEATAPGTVELYLP